MRITGLEIDGFGVWSGLKLEGLAEGLNVVGGPNEAGKTTLLQFVRSALYGFSMERRKYFPPTHGGPGGGSIDLAGPNGRFRLDRRDDPDNTAGNQERITLTAADGTRQSEHLAKVLLANVDEATYNNVFAVGLREMQQLGTLGDTEAAELLYSLTAGLDRVSLVEVMRELETSRNRILDAGGGPSQVTRLLDEREKLRREIEELGKSTRRYGRLAAEWEQLQREVTRLEEENNHAEHQARAVETAIAVRQRWVQRTALDDQLTALGPTADVPEDAVERLDAVNARLQKHAEHSQQLQRRRAELRSEASTLGINESLWRQAPRIEALKEQESWLAGLEGQIDELEKETAQLEKDLATEHQRSGLGDGSSTASLPDLSPRVIATLRLPGRALKRCRQQVGEAKEKVATAEENAQSLDRQIGSALSARGERDLAEAMDRAGNLAAQLRRRVQADERLDQMSGYQEELEEQSRRLVDRQLLPVWVLIALGAVFALGVMLAMIGLFTPGSITGSLGWLMIVVGLAGTGTAASLKIMLERSNARQLDACQRQLGMLQSQIRQAREERDHLDERLPGGGSPAGRLKAAEEELAALEELVPLDTRRVAARQEAEAAAAGVAQAEEEAAAARRKWRETVSAAGLPQLTPKHVRQLLQRCDHIGQLQRRLEHRREELTQRRRELDSLLGRIGQLVEETGVAVTGSNGIQRLGQLADTLREQETRVHRRDLLRREARQARQKRAKHEEAVSRLKHRRRELFRESDAKDEQELRHRAVQAARAEVLRQQHDALSREITAAVGEQCSEPVVRELIESGNVEQLETRRDELLDRLGALEKQLQGRFEKRGQLTEQLKAQADDRQMAVKQLDLAALEKRLEEAIARWQVLAVTCRTLEEIRTAYEQDRQPETLQEASGYLERLTRGRYRRVWTPLGEDVLRVDDAEGNALAVEVLSRGTREQLFLALRLALAGAYSRRGAPLPLVLDDVLVNFDADRAKAAVAVLRDFAAAGHQVLVFTCHEHILKLFKSLKVPVSRLPDNAEANPAPVIFEAPAKPKPKRSKKTPAPPAKRKKEPEEEPIDDEILAIDGSDADDEEDEYEWEEPDDEADDEDDYDEDAAEAA
ncbi:MAG TPA: AAA family ATPase [Thermoguttaceae bacterium]|nr:AAA family ATPase [Thermoguttaceae bacterium]